MFQESADQRSAQSLQHQSRESHFGFPGGELEQPLKAAGIRVAGVLAGAPPRGKNAKVILSGSSDLCGCAGGQRTRCSRRNASICGAMEVNSRPLGAKLSATAAISRRSSGVVSQVPEALRHIPGLNVLRKACRGPAASRGPTAALRFSSFRFPPACTGSRADAACVFPGHARRKQCLPTPRPFARTPS